MPMPMSKVTDLKAYTLCEKCNKEFELELGEDNSGIYSIFARCPFCGASNNRWLKILRNNHSRSK